MLWAASYWQQWLGMVVIALAAWAIVRELEVRLVILSAAMALGIIAWNPQSVVREFFNTFSNEKFVVPICSAMGFSHVLRYTGCDQHLVHLLVKPLLRVRSLLLPGTVLVGFLVNMPIVSQTSTAATLGPVIIPILRAAQFSPLTIGSALLLGSSMGGELLNPGAPELLTTMNVSQEAATVLNSKAALKGLRKPFRLEDYDSERCVRRILPLNFLGLLVGTLVFWYKTPSREKGVSDEHNTAPQSQEEAFKINWLKAAVPLLPLFFLSLTSFPFYFLELNPEWIENPTLDASASSLYQTRLIGFAMMLGVLMASCVSPGKMRGVMVAFFDGAGYGYAHIISLIVAANCFGQAIRAIGIADTVGQIIRAWPDLLLPVAGVIPLAFAALCGSGMASTQSLFHFFAAPALLLDIDPTHVGAVVSIASAAGRTMSPVAAVTLMCASLTDTRPLQLAKQVALPLLISVAIVIVAAMILVPAS